MTEKLINIKKSINKRNFKKAAALLKKYHKDTSNKSFTTLNWEAICLLEEKKTLAAIHTWEAALSFAGDSVSKIDLLWKIANCHISLKNYNLAKKVLKNSLEIDGSINNIEARQKICEICMNIKDYVAVENYVPKLLSYEKSYLPASFFLLESAIGLGDKKLVLKRLDKLMSHYKTFEPKHVVLVAEYFIILSEYEEGEKFLLQFNELYKQALWYQLILSWIYLETERELLVIEILKDKNIQDLIGVIQEPGLFYFVLGKSYEKSKLFQKAFECFTKMGELSKNKYMSFKPIDLIKSYHNIELLALDYSCSCEISPVFMIGFPRSGTTFLEMALDTHPNIVTLSEQETIASVAREAMSITNTKNLAKALERLSKPQIVSLQKLYFELVEKVTEIKANDVLIDKMPLNTIQLPLIKMLFPKSKFIISIRHPLDVVMSNFQQNFGFNNEMAFLFTIEDCVARYKQVFDFLFHFEQACGIDAIRVRYEDLVNDFDREINRLCEYIGVSNQIIQASILYNANHKVINTASRNQVTKPTYQSSVFKWKNYQKQLAPFEKNLADLIKKLGY
ncbi:sulfotransferase [Colwelliaceae bacterium 6471]